MKLSETETELDLYLKRLFPICRSITGDGNRETLRILQEIIPLVIHEVPSGIKCFDWEVPKEWNIKDAWIAELNGNKIVNFQDSNLHVVSYSEPINKIMGFSELSSHLYIHSEYSDAIPYRTSYYKRDWGFCVTLAQYKELEKLEQPFRVVIDSSLKNGSMSYGELLLPGKSSEEILISTYICHPSMANDNLSGMLLAAFLGRDLSQRKDRHFSYRLIFVPETIGAVAYCYRNKEVMESIDLGVVIATVGGSGSFGYKQSLDSDHEINYLTEQVFKEKKVKYTIYPFDIHGSDERQYSSQGFKINTVTISKEGYYKYPQYHTSLDDLDFVKSSYIIESLDIYLSLINKIEDRRIYKNCTSYCEVMLSKHNLYPKCGGAAIPTKDGYSELDLILWILFLCDGKNSVNKIIRILDVDSERLNNVLLELLKKNLIKEI